MFAVLALAPLLLGYTRKVKARALRRAGPPVLQPYRDLLKLIRKEAVLAHNASWLFRTAPYMILAATWVAAALVPTFATGLPFSWVGDLIAIIALLGSARFFLALAGMDIGTSFGGIGSSREMLFASLAEPAMIMIVFTVALVAGSTQLSSVAAFMQNNLGLRVSLGLAAALILVAIAENARIPVDNPATHLELTMVHEAMVLEYSRRHLAMLELAAAVKLLLYVSLIACIFVPWGLAPPGSGPAAYAAGATLYIGKLLAGGFLLVLFETSIAKMRVYIGRHFPELIELYDGTASLQNRTVSTGILSPDLVMQYGAGGFVGRASGRLFDARKTPGYAPYDNLAFDVPLRQAGDVDARVWVRIEEVLAADGRLARCHLRDPSWFQWPLLEAAIAGNIVADFPLCNKSFNCSYSGHDL
jgi:formate hydrogenlyase subunit 4